MKYKYNSAINAIISLETAYTNKSLDAILASKDFKTEAILILEQASYKYDLTDETIIYETANLLELTLIQSLKENGYPSFENVERQFTELNNVRNNIYSIEEKLIFPNNSKYINKIFLTVNNNIWKVAMIEE